MHTKSLADIPAIKVQVDNYLKDYFERKITSSESLGAPYQTLVGRMKQFTLRGGKRLRPYLVYLGYIAAEGAAEPPIEVLAAIELFHNSLLIHDDIMDRDISRYGGPNIAGLYLNDFKEDAHHQATSAALLAGDLNISFAHELILASSLTLADKQTVVESLTRQYQEVIAGQLLDSLPQPGRTTTPDNITQIQLLKTAAYTTVGPLQIGATLAHGHLALLAKLREYGENLGLLFQTTDDLLGTFGSEVITGKPNCTDLHERKPTMLLFYANQRCKGAELDLLNSLVGNPHAQDEDMAQVRNILTSSGAKAQTEELALKYANQAVAIASKIQGPAGEVLKTLPLRLVHRLA